ncbi:MAG: hypothetical protein WC005_05825 [Candidatus Nanopelagicales bacterium]
MPGPSTFLHEHQSEITAVVVGLLGALAFLALLRKAIKVFAVLVIAAALVTTWWLSREQDAWAQVQDLLHLVR